MRSVGVQRPENRPPTHHPFSPVFVVVVCLFVNEWIMIFRMVLKDGFSGG